MTTSFTLERYGDVPLRFRGDVIGEASSDNGQPRYAIIRIYRNEDGRYVVEQLGVSRLPGERTLIRVDICDDAQAVRRTCARREAGRTFHTDVALDALDQAAANDHVFREQAAVEVI